MTDTAISREPADTRARVTFLPFQTGDGYGWGGGVILTIMGMAIPLGEGREAEKLAKEIARRWNDQEPAPHD